MASVEEIQKVNALAQELLKNSVAHSLDDALNKAQNILSINLGPMVHHAQMAKIVESSSNPDPKSETIINDDNNLEDIKTKEIQKEVSTMTNPNTLTKQDLEQEINKLKVTMNEAMGKLYEEVKKLIINHDQSISNEFSKIKRGSGAISAPTSITQPSQVQQKEEVQQITIEEKKPHPRQGNFSPGDSDVNIQKIFYYGDK